MPLAQRGLGGVGVAGGGERSTFEQARAERVQWGRDALGGTGRFVSERDGLRGLVAGEQHFGAGAGGAHGAGWQSQLTGVRRGVLGQDVGVGDRAGGERGAHEPQHNRLLMVGPACSSCGPAARVISCAARCGSWAAWIAAKSQAAVRVTLLGSRPGVSRAPSSAQRSASSCSSRCSCTSARIHSARCSRCGIRCSRAISSAASASRRAVSSSSRFQMAQKQLGTLKETEKQVGHLNWTPFNTSAAVNNPASLPTEFGRWVLAGGPMPDKMTGSVNCWEMVLFGAFKAGFLSFARIQTIYGNAVANVKSGKTTLVGDTVQEELRGSDPHTLDLSDPNSPRPLAGDLVVFNKAAVHIAIATGTMVSGKHGVISLWNQPGNISTVQRTTIEDILAAMPNGGASGKPVQFWTAKW